MSPESRACLILIGAFTTISVMTFRGAPSPDLLASWVAGQMWAAGETGQIYPALDTVFPMLPPEGWPKHLAAQGYVGAVFPFVYPPIWAVLTGALTRLFSLAVFEDAATLLNPLALGGMCWLALRATGPGKLPRPVLLAVGLFLMLVTLPGAVALEQNQPQILVSLLIVAAIERDRAGAPRAAGIALAVAASIKLYPVLFTVIWLARRRWGALATFTIAGAVLGGASVALAGWPLHAEFLALVGSIRHTALVTSFTYGIDAGIAQIWFADALRFVTGHGQTGDVTRGWTILEKPGAWVALSTAALVAVLGAAAAVAARRPGSLLLLARDSDRGRTRLAAGLGLSLPAGPRLCAAHPRPGGGPGTGRRTAACPVPADEPSGIRPAGQSAFGGPVSATVGHRRTCRHGPCLCPGGVARRIGLAPRRPIPITHDNLRPPGCESHLPT